MPLSTTNVVWPGRQQLRRLTRNDIDSVVSSRYVSSQPGDHKGHVEKLTTSTDDKKESKTAPEQCKLSCMKWRGYFPPRGQTVEIMLIRLSWQVRDYPLPGCVFKKWQQKPPIGLGNRPPFCLIRCPTTLFHFPSHFCRNQEFMRDFKEKQIVIVGSIFITQAIPFAFLCEKCYWYAGLFPSWKAK